MAQGNPGKGESRNTQLVRENERLKMLLHATQSAKRYNALAAITKQLIKYGTIGVTTWASVREIAGKTTVLDAAVDVCGGLADAIMELAPSWMVQIVTVFVAVVVLYSNKRFRANNAALVSRLSKVSHDYETKFDPNRRSSGLGPHGETNEKDDL